MHRRLARTALFVALAASSVACTKTLDTTNLQTQLQAQLQSELGAQNLTVHCPDSVKVQAGATFTCTATDPGGQSLTILVTQKDDQRPRHLEVLGRERRLEHVTGRFALVLGRPSCCSRTSACSSPAC